MRVLIDHDRCTGHGRCYALAPDLFTDDDAGYGRAVGDGSVPAELAAGAGRAVVGCPEHAISIIREGPAATRP